MARPILVTFVAGSVGPWTIERIEPVVGATLPPATHLFLAEGSGDAASSADAAWALQGFTSNERYVSASERSALTAVQEPLGRSLATQAALIPIRKTEAWWDLTQDARRAILEEQSHHIATGLEYLPAVARRLHHARDLGGDFDFLTWFEYPPSAADAFEELVTRLRATEEWSYIDREVDIRLSR
jgi:chlorite dismutase